MRLMGWSFAEACFTGVLVGVGVGLLGGHAEKAVGAWCLALALRMILKARDD